jgi:hypothetical protein
VGRVDFRGIELIHNGRVVRQAASRPSGGHFVAEMKFNLQTSEPGWVALRIPLDAGKSELDGALFAHTSPIFLTLNGKRIFRPEVATGLIDEMKQSVEAIKAKGVFADDQERDAVLQVYREGIETLRRRLSSSSDETALSQPRVERHE